MIRPALSLVLLGLAACEGSPSTTVDLGHGADLALDRATLDRPATRERAVEGGAADRLIDRAPGEAGPAKLKVLAQYTDAMHAILFAAGFVYAVSSATDTVLVFDTKTQTQVGTIAVGRVPGALATDGARVFVANRLAKDAGDAYVSVIDIGSQKVVKSLPVSEKVQGNDPMNYPWTNFPWDVWYQAGKLYVDFPGNAVPDVVAVDATTWQEAVPLWSAGSGPAELAGAGDRLVVANDRVMSSPGDDALQVYTTAGVLVATHETGGRLHELVEAGGKVFAARAPASGQGELLVVDPQSTAAPVVMKVAAGAYGLAVSGGAVHVMCQTAMEIDVVDATSLKVVRQIPIPASQPPVVNPRTLAVAPNGDIYIESDGMISVLTR